MKTNKMTIEKQDLIELMYELHAERPVFWSEADFQHALAWKIKETWNNAKIRLERRYDYKVKPGSTNEHQTTEPYYVDIWVELSGKCYPIELKYKTADVEIKDTSEDSVTGADSIHLKAQSAQDMGRYDFLKDIQRIEHIRSNNPKFGKGFAIILTNDFHYYQTPKKEIKTLDRQFRIHEGVQAKHGNLQWISNDTSKEFTYENKTKKKHWTHKYPPLHLDSHYEMRWIQYKNKGIKDTPSSKPEVFRFAVCSIENENK